MLNRKKRNKKNENSAFDDDDDDEKKEKGWSSFSQKSTSEKRKNPCQAMLLLFLPLCATYFLQLDNKITPNPEEKLSLSFPLLSFSPY